jgi:hypothetical protein
VAEQLNTAGATRLAERPARTGPAASTTISTTSNTSHDSAHASAVRGGSSETASAAYGSAHASAVRGGSSEASSAAHDSAHASAVRGGSSEVSSASHDSAEGSVARGGSGGTSSTPATGTKPIPFAAVSFVCGLVGLLVANLVLGPLAIVLGAMGLRADKNRRVRAVLGIVLGVADIAVFLFLAAHSSGQHASLSWNFFGN